MGETRAPDRRRHGRRLAVWFAGALVLVLVVLIWNAGDELVSGDCVGWISYLVVVALVFGDAVCPILPGETTLNAASVLASQGRLQIGVVMACGALGAVGGDSAVYWIARRAKGRLRTWMDRAADGEKAQKVIALLHRHGPTFLLFGRYIPGVRFALNAALGGVIAMPYRTFLCWSALSGTLWSVLTCTSAYLISDALSGYPVLSLVLTCMASTVLISLAIWIQNLRR